jgi:hypothetical protein
MSVPPENVIVDESVSVASYKPKTEMDYGTLLCWGDNELGRQAVPCVFHIIPAGKKPGPFYMNKKCLLFPTLIKIN